MNSLKVAIVDDDHSTRNLVSDLLRNQPEIYAISVYTGSREAIKCIPQELPNVVLMDINMPGMNGIECVRQLKPKHPNVHFIMLTVYDDTPYIFDALASGAVGYLLKRSINEDLISAITDVVNGGSPMDSDIARKVVQSFQKKPETPNTREFDELSERELEVLKLLARGKLYKEIADHLDISIHTVRTYIRRIYEKLHVNTRSEAIAKFTNLQ